MAEKNGSTSNSAGELGAGEGAVANYIGARDELLGCHFAQMAVACNALRDAAHRLLNDGADELLGNAVLALAEKTGWRADQCTRLIEGGPGCLGEWENWVSSPREFKAAQALKDLTHA